MAMLYLLRHAKSDWDDLSLADHDRPLAKRGEHAARLMGKRMRNLGIRPDLILCSTACRTRETLALVDAEAGFDAPIVFSEDLYGAGVGTILEIVRHQEPVERLMLIGHNPGFQDTALALAGGGDPLLMDHLRYKLPTGTLVGIDFGAQSLDAAVPGRGRLVLFERPADQTNA